jgi:hypothetical protein
LAGVALEEIEYVATPIADSAPNFDKAAAGAAGSLALDRAFGALSDFGVVVLLQQLVEVVHVVTVTSGVPCSAK